MVGNLENIRMKKMEELVRKQNDPKNKAKEFARVILECEEYKNFIKYNDQFRRDQTAQNLLRQFQQKQMELQRNEFNPNTLEELKDLQVRINKNDAIQYFVNAQQELVDLLRRTNDIISGKVGTQFAFSQGGGCCG